MSKAILKKKSLLDIATWGGFNSYSLLEEIMLVINFHSLELNLQLSASAAQELCQLVHCGSGVFSKLPKGNKTM